MRFKYKCECGFKFKIQSGMIKKYGIEIKRCPCGKVMKRIVKKANGQKTYLHKQTKMQEICGKTDK